MIQVKCPIDAENILEFEEFISFQNEIKWIITSNNSSKSHFISGYFITLKIAQDEWENLTKAHSFLPHAGHPEFVELDDCSWRQSYKYHQKPWNFNGIHWVPAWEKSTYTIPKGDQSLFLDSDMAFGTSDHPSTRLCLIAILEFITKKSPDQNSTSVIDAGCGSGILALTAAKLGCKPIFAFDNDPLAIRVSLENADRNGLGEAIEVRLLDLEIALKNRFADLIVANLLSSILCRYAPQLVDALHPSGLLVLSGIQKMEVNGTLDSFRERIGVRGKNYTFSISSIENWSSIVISKPS